MTGVTLLLAWTVAAPRFAAHRPSPIRSRKDLRGWRITIRVLAFAYVAGVVFVSRPLFEGICELMEKGPT